MPQGCYETQRNRPGRTYYSLLSILTIGELLTGFIQARAQQTKVKKKVNLKGVITDTTCGAKHMVTEDDAKCVRACVKGGSHFALLVGNDVYSLLGNDEELDKLAGDRVAVLGTLEDGKAMRIVSLQLDAIPNSPKSNSNSASGNSAESQATIKGLVRDIACPIQNKVATARAFNLKCALECVRAGSPIVIQTDDGTLYLPISTSMPDEDQRRVCWEIR
jgi:hypothetical protein